MPRLGVVLILLSLLASSTLLFHRASLAQMYPFTHYTSADGLAHAAVRKIFQDSHGNIWFGTQGGLNRFDGDQFAAYLTGGSERAQVNDIWEAPDGILWIATEGLGIALLSPDSQTVRWMNTSNSQLPSNWISSIYEDVAGALWLSSDAGISRLRPDGTQNHYGREAGLPDPYVYTLVRSGDGDLWIATPSGVYRTILLPDGRLSAERVITNPSRSLLVRSNGDLVVGSSGGNDDRNGFICSIRGSRRDTLITYATADRLVKGQTLCEDEDGELWVGTGYGLYIVRESGISHLGLEHGLMSENVYDIMQDREGTLWFATDNGVMKLTSPRFLSYTQRQGLSSYVTLSMVADRTGNLWCGTWNGLNRIAPDNTITRWDESRGLFHHVIYALAEDARGRLWIGTQGGLDVLSGGRVVRPLIRGLDARKRVFSLATARDGTVWLGHEQGITQLRDGNVAAVVGPQQGFPRDNVTALVADEEGGIWFGTRNSGAGYYRNGRIRMLNARSGLPSNRIRSLSTGPEGSVWIGTESGLVRFHGGEIDRPEFPPAGLSTKVVHFVMADAGGHSWIGTDYGVYEVRGSVARLWSSRDGLASDIVVRAVTGNNGSLWFGTHGGVSVLQRTAREHAVPVPSIRLTGIIAGDRSVAVTDTQEFGYEERSVSFTFNAPSFIDERGIVFQWTMEGFDPGWLEPQRHRIARYTNLAPGSYTFAVRAANRNGSWSEPVRVPFTITPPFWQREWFVGLAAVVVLAALATAYRIRINQVLRVERMRTRIAADLHDDIASSLASIALYSDAAGQLVHPRSPETSELFGRIRDLSREVMENIGLIVWSVDPGKDDLLAVFDFFQRHARSLCGAAGVRFTVQTRDEQRSAPFLPEQRRVVYLILKEALNNSLRHSGCSEVQFDWHLKGRLVEVRLRDNGTGFDATMASTGHGLKNMTMRARQIGTTLEVVSPPGGGTTVTLQVKMA